VVVEDEDGKLLEEHAKFLGVATNNVAEYKAAVLGLERAKALGAKTVEVRADSELMVKQASGEYRVKNIGLKPLYEKLKILETHFDKVRYRHVRREQNKAADALANQAMDKGY
jgi:ribonuclease HI